MRARISKKLLRCWDFLMSLKGERASMRPWTERAMAEVIKIEESWYKSIIEIAILIKAAP